MNPFSPSFSQIPKIKINRDDAKNHILTNIFDTYYGTTTFITGPRGCGKTVLMQMTKQEVLKHSHTIVIYLQNGESLLNQLEQILSKEILSLKINVKAFGLEIGVNQHQVSQIVTIIDELRVLTKHRHVIIEIDDVTNSAQIRTFGQIKGAANANDINFDTIMTGLPNVITDITNNKELTFLLRSDKIYLQPLDRLAIADKYQEALNVSDASIRRQLVRMTNGYAFAFQLLGQLLYQQQPITTETIKAVENQYFDKLANDVYIKIFADLAPNERRYLLNMNQGMNVTQIAKLWNVKTLASVSQYKKPLIGKGIISPNSPRGKIQFELPEFSKYLTAVCDPESFFYEGYDVKTGLQTY